MLAVGDCSYKVSRIGTMSPMKLMKKNRQLPHSKV